MPRAGELTVITVQHGDGKTLPLRGHVVYVEPRMGFSLRFEEMAPEVLEALQTLIDSILKESAEP
jgi:hypothetical protein